VAEKVERREFLKRALYAGLPVLVGGESMSRMLSGSPRTVAGAAGSTIAVVKAASPEAGTDRAIDILGGMGRFVKKGSRVALLANTQSRHPGTYTKPEILRSLIRQCREAGAAKISCLSWLPLKSWEASGLAAAVSEAGADLVISDLKDSSQFQAVSVPGGRIIKEVRLLKTYFLHDVFINVPITKDHIGNKFTGAMKNLMGLNFPEVNRAFHTGDFKTVPDDIEHLDQCIVDLNKAVPTHLCVVDATEIITTNGPFGPGILARPGKIVAGLDRVAVDACCASILGLGAADVLMIRRGGEQGLGSTDFKKSGFVEKQI